MPTTDNLQIKISLDNAASSGLNQAKFSVKELGKAVDLASRSMRRFAQASLGSTDNLNAQLNAVAANMKVLNKALADVTKKSQVTSDRINNLNNALTKTARGGLRRFDTSLSGIRGKLNGVARGLMGLKGLVVGVGAGLLAKSFVDAADAAENYRVRLNVVLRSQQEANLLFKEVGDYASTVSFEYKDLLESSTRLAGVMKGGGQEVTRYLPIIADLAAATGVGIQEATGQVIRMYSAGAASADLFRERGVLSMLGFQAGVKYTAEETKKQLIAAFEDPESRFRDASKELAKTWSGMLSMMSDRWFQFRNQVMEAGVFDYIKAAADLFLKFMDDLKRKGKFGDWAAEQAKVVINVLGKIAIAASWVLDIFRGWNMLWQGLKIAASALGIVLTKIASALNWITTQMMSALEGAVRMASKLTSVFTKIGLGGNLSRDIEAMADYLLASENNLRRIDREYDQQIQNLKEVISNSSKNLGQLGEQLNYNERIKKVLKEINDLVEKRRRIREANAWGPFRPVPAGSGSPDLAGGKGSKPVTDVDRIRAELTEWGAIQGKLLAQLDSEFSAFGKVAEYYDVRISKAKEAFQYEHNLLEQVLEAADKPRERHKAAIDIYVLEQNHQKELINLELARSQAIQERLKKEQEVLEARQKGKTQAAGLVRGAQSRVGVFAAGGLEAQFAQQNIDLENRQAEEQQRLLDLKKKGYADELDAFKLHQAHMLEQEKLMADQRSMLVNTYFSATRSVLGNVSSAFQDFYKATGERHKEFFHLYKAAAVAETIIGTYQSAQDAYKSLAGIPYVGPALAAAAAGAAIAAGVARVAVIRAQKMAVGGLVGGQDISDGGTIEGYSPTSTSDNVPVQATAGEFMQPVSTVRHYGVQAMEAIRQKLVPREVLSQFASPGLRSPAGAFLAGGGMVASGGAGSSYSVNVPVTTIDTVDGLATRLQGSIEGAVRRILDEELS